MDQSLPILLRELGSGERPLHSYLAELQHHFPSREPDLRAFLPEEGRFTRLYHEAEMLLARYPHPPTRPPLFGLPVGVKDIFQVDGFVCRAGSKLPPILWAGAEATAVSRLKQAGALILGQTVTTEFAYFAPGPTRNPHHLGHTPGGSSSGSAAAVAAGLCPMALGSQTIGSINRPAAYCGVVGFKPTYGRIPRTGVLPLAPSVDAVGLFGSDVAGVDVVAGVLCDQWQGMVVNGHPLLGVPEGPYLAQASAAGLAHFHATCARLSDAGYTIKHIPAMADLAEINGRHRLIVAAEAYQVHASWYAQFAPLYHPKTAELLEMGQKVTDSDLRQAVNGRSILRSTLVSLMEAHQIDLWLSPSAVDAAPEGLDSTGDPVMNLPWTHAGLPTLTLPTGKNEAGLPLGLQLTGRWYGDEMLLAWAEEMAHKELTQPPKP